MDFQQIRDFVNPAVAQATGLQEVDNLQMPVPTAFVANGNGGGSVTVDSELSATSTNPVENRVITAALNNMACRDVFIVNIEIPFQSAPVLITPFSDISDAYFSGKILSLRAKMYMSNDNDNIITSPAELSYVEHDGENVIGDFVFVSSLGHSPASGNNFSVNIIDIDDSGEVSISQKIVLVQS